MLHRLRYTAGYEAVTADRRFKITILFVAGERVSQEPGQIKQFSKPCRSSLQAQAACTCPKLCLSVAHAPFFLGVCKRVSEGKLVWKAAWRRSKLLAKAQLENCLYCPATYRRLRPARVHLIRRWRATFPSRGRQDAFREVIDSPTNMNLFVLLSLQQIHRKQHHRTDHQVDQYPCECPLLVIGAPQLIYCC